MVSARRYLAVCVSRRPESWNLSEVPFFCYSDPTDFPRVKSRERIDYLATVWNKSHSLGLEKYPETTHVINVGSQYLSQIDAIRRLVQRYEEIDDNDIILAGNVWAKLELLLGHQYFTYDPWAYPDLSGLAYRWRLPSGTVQISSVGMPCIYPIHAWKDNPFKNPENMEEGIWYNRFCKEAGLPVLADLSIRFYRTKDDSDIPRASLKGRAHREVVLARRTVMRKFGLWR